MWGFVEYVGALSLILLFLLPNLYPHPLYPPYSTFLSPGPTAAVALTARVPQAPRRTAPGPAAAVVLTVRAPQAPWRADPGPAVVIDINIEYCCSALNHFGFVCFIYTHADRNTNCAETLGAMASEGAKKSCFVIRLLSLATRPICAERSISSSEHQQ